MAGDPGLDFRSPDRNVYKEAVETWGASEQLDRVVEECAELIHAIQKLRRHGKNPDKITAVIGEIADVYTVLHQTNYIFDAEQISLAQQRVQKKLADRIDAARNEPTRYNVFEREDTAKVANWS